MGFLRSNGGRGPLCALTAALLGLWTALGAPAASAEAEARSALIAPPVADPEVAALADGYAYWLGLRLADVGITPVARQTVREHVAAAGDDPKGLLALAERLGATYAVFPALHYADGDLEVVLRLKFPGSAELLATSRARAPLASLGTACDDTMVRLLKHLGVAEEAFPDAPPPQLGELASTARALRHRDAGRLFRAWREVQGRLSPTPMGLREQIVAEARRSDAPRIERARVLAATGNEREAWALISPLIPREAGQEPDDPAVLVAAAEVQLARNNVVGARTHFQAALDRNPDDADALLGFGEVLSAYGDDAGARRAYERAAELLPDDPRPLLLLASLSEDRPVERGRLMVRAGERSGALLDASRADRYFKRAAQIAPSLAGETWRASGEFRQRVGEPEKAVTHFERAQDAGVADLAFFRNFARAQAATGDDEAAEISLRQALREDGDDAVSLRELGRIHVERGQTDAALGFLERAARVAPDDPDTALAFARALRVAGQPARALEVLGAGAADGPALLREAASIHAEAGRLDAAIAALGRGAEQAPDDPELHAELAALHERAGDADAAALQRELAILLGGEPAAEGTSVPEALVSSVSFDEFVLSFATQVRRAEHMRVVHLGARIEHSPKALALEWLHPRRLDPAAIDAAFEAALARRFVLLPRPPVADGSLLENYLTQIYDFESEISHSSEAIATVNQVMETEGVFVTTVRRAAASAGCGGLEAFEVEVRLLAGDYEDGTSILANGSCPPGGVREFGQWNARAFAVYAVVLLLLASPLLRGWGTIVVHIALPPRTRGFFHLKISKSGDEAPAEPKSGKGLGERIRRVLRTASRFERSMAGRETVFRWVPARKRPYAITLMGPLKDATGEEIVEQFLEERRVRVQRGKVAKIEYDLRPKECAIEVQIMLDGAPAPEARVAVAGNPSSLRYAQEGKAFLYLGLGSYRLLLGAADRVAEYPLDIESLDRPIPLAVDLAEPYSLVFSGCPAAVDPYLQGDYDTAANALRAAGNEQAAHFVRANWFQQRGDAARAAAEFQAAGRFEEAAELAAGEDADPLLSANLFERAGQHARAAELYQTAGETANAARCFEAAYDWESALECYRELGDPEKELELLERTGDFLEAATMARARGDAERALRCIEQISRNEGNYADACSLLSQILHERGETDLAVEKSGEAVREAGGEYAPLELLERHAELLEKCEEREKAVEVLGWIVKREPSREDLSARLNALREEVRSRADATPTRVGPGLEQQEESRYELIEELGRGGMGVVYKARDRRLGRFVALKHLPNNLRDHPDAVNLFLREAQAAAVLNHRNIVTLFDAGEENGTFFITMELLEGLPLNHILRKRGALSGKDAARLGVQICAGLAYAHSQRIVHRDIKTANLFFTRDRVVKIMDFGLAKTIEEVRKNSTVIGGTPYYMAPEQAVGDAVDHRADLYSLGVTLFQLVTGDMPFREGDLAYHHRHTPAPDAREYEANVPAELAELILQLMAKDPADRPQSAVEVAHRLQAMIS